MKFITRLDYLKYNNLNMMLKEESEEYKKVISGEIEYNQDKIEEVDKKHDKMFKVIFGRKLEVAKFLNEFLDLKEKITEEEIIKYPTEFITKQYMDKYSDIIYKLKNKQVYFLIEHQSTINKNMVEKIGIYVHEIMRREKKDGLYPIVVPIVIYTGFKKWNAKTSFFDKQYRLSEYEEYKINLWYNLVAIQNYSFEELLEKKTLFASFMIMEKCTNSEILIIQMDKIIEMLKENEDRIVLSEIIDNIIAPRVGREIATKMLGKINKKEEISMSPLTKMLFDLEINGMKKGIIETAKKMLQKNMKIKDIEEITGLSKEEIEKLEKCV